ncbi:MAG: undecaprenyldiphospho-muramoylpentapeptide beta-N-acetylglucosaminyltransferase [Terriglobales bacterium]
MPALRQSIVIAGGGTGGHLMPGLAVARALRAAGADDLVFVGTARGLEERLVPAAGFELRLITIGGLKSGSLVRRAATLLQLPRAVAQSVRILRQRHVSVVFGIGGYASGPVLAAAALLRIPIVVLEVNANTGLANRWAARWVSAAAVNFPETARDFRNALFTGIPVRPEFFQARAPAEPPLVLIFGGSQGARALNEAATAMAPQINFRILHQTGTRDYEAVAAAYAPLGERVRAMAFIENMAGAMGEATLVVCRSGASTLGEIAAAQKPAILVPYPAAADQHQLRNAQAYARAGAAVLLEQSQLTHASLAAAIASLLADAPYRAALQAALAPFAHPDAAESIAQLVLRQRG